MTASLQPAQAAGPANSTALILATSAAVAAGEDAAAYDDLAARIANAVAPATIIEQLWVRDVVDLVWEVVRLRRYKASLLTTRAYLGMDAVLKGLGESHFFTKSREGAARKPTATADVNAQLANAGLGPDAVAAATFAERIDEFERIEKLIASAESRRAAILREIELYRASLAARLREQAERATTSAEGEFEEVAPAAGPDA
jgi:hypothetical protein